MSTVKKINVPPNWERPDPVPLGFTERKVRKSGERLPGHVTYLITVLKKMKIRVTVNTDRVFHDALALYKNSTSILILKDLWELK